MKATKEELKGIPTREELLETALAYAKQAEEMAIKKLNESDAKVPDLLLLEAIKDLIIFLKLAQ